MHAIFYTIGGKYKRRPAMVGVVEILLKCALPKLVPSGSLGYNTYRRSGANTYESKLGCAEGSGENPPPTKV